jgi:dienelactone hydrolase
MKWTGAGTTSKGVRERGFALERGGHSVPGIAWTPENAQAPTPVVLIGHGGSGHKREPHILALARRLVRHHGIAAAAIDGPLHGDRAPAGAQPTLAARRAAYRDGQVLDGMIADWKATLDALQKLPEIGVGKVGYWGLSMGTMFGLPFVAAEPRIAVATLGLMGTGVFADGRLERDATSVTCPVLFLQQWDDELIPRERAAALFGAIASADKRLHAHPGAHAAVPPEEFAFTEAFLAKRLG